MPALFVVGVEWTMVCEKGEKGEKGIEVGRRASSRAVVRVSWLLYRIA